MKVSQIISDVRGELVEANAGFWSDAELLRLAARAESDFVNKTRCLDGKAYLSTVAGQPDYILPSNVLSVFEVYYNNPNTTTGLPVWQKIPLSNVDKIGQVNQDFLSSDPALRNTPSRCWIFGRSLWFDSTPDVTGSANVCMFGKMKPIVLTQTTQDLNIDDSLSEAINNFMLWKAWKKEKEKEEAAEYEALYNMNVKEGRRWVKLQDLGQRKRLDIESPRDFDGEANGFNPFKA